MLSGGDNHCRRVGGHHSWEDGTIADEQVIHSVNLDVCVDDGGTAASSIISSDLGGAEPVVGPSS